MSSTNRGSTRSPADYYPTPAWCLHRLLEEVQLPSGIWLEPCAGDGALIRAAATLRPDVSWRANELRPACRPTLEAATGGPGRVNIGALSTQMAWCREQRADVVITNPPFRLAQDVLERCLQLSDCVVLLLRLNFLASIRRAELMRTHPPDVYVLPNRPSFTGGGKTDSIDYAWFVWRGRPAGESGRLKVLAVTPPGERRATPRQR